MEPGGREEETMEDSESQILHPLELRALSTSLISPTIADFPMKPGNFLEASSQKEASRSASSVSEGVFGAVRGLAAAAASGVDDGALDCSTLECFFAFEFEGILNNPCVERRRQTIRTGDESEHNRKRREREIETVEASNRRRWWTGRRRRAKWRGTEQRIGGGTGTFVW